MTLLDLRWDQARFRIVDVETTGFDPARDRVVEIAAVDLCPAEGVLERPTSHLVNPGRRIPAGARAVHGISDAMVANAPPLEQVLDQYRDDRVVLVAHNATFDAGFLPALSGPWLCTLRLAQHLFPQAPSYGNQALREWRGIDALPPWTQGLAAHRALYDAAVTGLVLDDLLGELRRSAPEVVTVADLLAFARRPVLLKTIRFGKHRGQRFEDLPRSYLRWLAETDAWGEDLAHTVRTLLERRS